MSSRRAWLGLQVQRCWLLEERACPGGNEFDDAEVERLTVELHQQGEDDAESDGSGYR